MVADITTPGGFDFLLMIASLPLLGAALVLFWRRSRAYRAHPTAWRLELFLGGIAWLTMAVTFIVRPIADLSPTTAWVTLEQLVAPGARLILTAIAIVLLVHDRRVG